MKKPFNLQEWLADKNQKVVWGDETPADIENIELHFLLNTDDLFFVTEDEELTEFEEKVWNITNFISLTEEPEVFEKQVKKFSEELLAIARKQIEKEKLNDAKLETEMSCFPKIRKPRPALTRIVENLTPEKLEKTKKEMLAEPSDDSGQLDEDEMIRKAILGLTYLDGIEPILTKCSVTRGDIRAYLEKQKSTNSYKPTYEQMEALRFAINHLAKEYVSQSVRLSIMYDHLKEED